MSSIIYKKISEDILALAAVQPELPYAELAKRFQVSPYFVQQTMTRAGLSRRRGPKAKKQVPNG